MHQALLPRLEHIGSRTEFAITGRSSGEHRRGRVGLVFVGAAHIFEVRLGKGASLSAGRQLVKAGRRVGERLLEQAGDELLLRAKVMKQATLRHARFLSHPCERHRLDAIATHDRCSRIEQLHTGLRRSGLLGGGTLAHWGSTLALT